MAGFFYPSSEYATGRRVSPNLDPNLSYLVETKILPEGHYTIEAWPLECRGRISFAFYNNGIFQPTFILDEKSFETTESTQEWWSRIAYNLPVHQYQPALAQRYCSPVIKRDAAIVQALRDISWVQERAVRRVRKGERYLIYFERAHGPCDNWFAPHIHSCQVTVLDPADRHIIKEVYGCDEIGKGVQHYLDTLNDFDDARMETIL